MSSFRSPLIIRRVSGGAWAPNGEFTGEQESQLIIHASVQPLPAKEMLSLPEGRRTRAAYALFTDTEVRVTNAQNPDRVKLFGDDYEVIKVEPWQNGVIPHFKITVSKVSQDAAPVQVGG